LFLWVLRDSFNIIVKTLKCADKKIKIRGISNSQEKLFYAFKVFFFGPSIQSDQRKPFFNTTSMGKRKFSAVNC